MLRTSQWLMLGTLTLGLAGCGLPAQTAIAPSRLATMTAADDPDHAQMNAIVRGVLTAQWSTLTSTIDANHDGAIAKAEYAKGHSAQLTTLFMTEFDANKDGVVTQSEYAAAVQADPAVEAYHHLTEQNMSAALKPLLAGNNFGFTQLRSYMTQGLGLTGDWPLLAKIFGQLDLNKDQKLFSNQDESSAFMLFFAQAQLQHDLGLPVTPIQ